MFFVFAAVTLSSPQNNVFAEEKSQLQVLTKAEAAGETSYKWKSEKDVTVGGRLFDTAFVVDTANTYYPWFKGDPRPERITFRNGEGYDFFEAWIGRIGSNQKVEEFTVLGDGEELYK